MLFSGLEAVLGVCFLGLRADLQAIVGICFLGFEADLGVGLGADSAASILSSYFLDILL